MVLFDPHRYAYPSRRSVVYARRAMACTSVPLGAQVGLDVMKAGGNAVDAAVAMAAMGVASSAASAADYHTSTPQTVTAVRTFAVPDSRRTIPIRD